MATPSKTEQESQSHKGEEFLKLSCFGHVGVFKVESPLLEVAEELLDSPTQLVKGEGCLLYTSPSPRDLSTSRMPSSA